MKSSLSELPNAQTHLLLPHSQPPPTAMDHRPPPPPWQHLTPTLTHILTHPTTTPSLHSQLLLATLIPSPLHRFSPYPPILSPAPVLLRWSLSLFLRRLLPPPTSWRSKCPFQLPPPLILSSAVDPAPPQWGAEERRAYVRKRLRRGRLGIKVPPLVAVAVPNLLLMSLLLLDLDPLWGRRQ